VSRRVLLGISFTVFLTVADAQRANAQLIVNDPVNTLQNIAILGEALRIYQEAQRLRAIWEQFRQGIDAARRVEWTIDKTRWRTHGDVEDPFGTYEPLGQAFDLGDPDNRAYLGSIIPLDRYPSAVLATLPAAQREYVSRDYANVLMADGFGRVAVQTTSNARSHSRRALDALDALQADLLNQTDEYNGNVGLLQKTLGARLLSVRTTDVGNQLLASLLEGALSKQKILRDEEARQINTDIVRRIVGPSLSQQSTAQMDQVLSTYWDRVR